MHGRASANDERRVCQKEGGHPQKGGEENREESCRENDGQEESGGETSREESDYRGYRESRVSFYLKRRETSAPGTSEGDWLEAERLLSK